MITWDGILELLDPGPGLWAQKGWTLDRDFQKSRPKNVQSEINSSKYCVFLDWNLGPESSISGSKVQAQGPAIPKCHLGSVMVGMDRQMLCIFPLLHDQKTVPLLPDQKTVDPFIWRVRASFWLYNSKCSNVTNAGTTETKSQYTDPCNRSDDTSFGLISPWVSRN